MTISPLDSHIFGPLFADPAVAALFADEAYLRRLVQVEAALATVQGRLGVIPAEAATTIAAAAATFQPDFATLQEGTERAGVPTIALLEQLRAHTGRPAAGYLHWGATSQDVMDTALVLQLRDALALLEPLLQQVIESLARLAGRHRHTLMAGRTHSQQALPITFGLKVAGWLAPLLRHRQRLAELRPRLLVVQLGGAAGTLAALGSAGPAVQQALAAELGLGVPPLPWHTQRDNLAELAGWLSLVSGSLGKLAQDVILLAQTEIAEVHETADLARGGSSTMPQKRNPMVSERILAAARYNAALLATMHQALLQEHERATHGWQLEWLALPQMLALTGGALRQALFLGEHLVVDEQRMRQNVAAGQGLMLAEALTFALAAHMDRPEAKTLVTEACRRAIAEDRHLLDIAAEMTDAPLDWPALKDEATYLGAAGAFIERVLGGV